MSTSILDTGEAFLPSDEKRYARVEMVHQHIEHDSDVRLAPALGVLLALVAVAGLTLAVFAL